MRHSFRTPAPASGRRRLPLLATVLAALLAALGPTLTAQAQSAPMLGRPGNPLAGRPWGIDTQDALYRAYAASTGTQKKLLAKIALRPRVRWFPGTPLIPAADITDKVRKYITASQAGDPSTLVPMAAFGLWPKGESHKSDPLTAAEQAEYRRWVDNLARGIGSAHVVMVLEPDLVLALKGWRPAVRLQLARYAAQILAALPHTTVYLDAGDSDWLTVPQAVGVLRAAGIRYVRGFALGATHYTSTAANIVHGTQIVAALAKAGYPGRHFVIDTSDNGRPFTYGQYYAKHPNGLFDNAETCRTRTETRCDTLGIAPTAQVGAPRRGLTPHLRSLARAHADAFLWFSRPWLVYGPPAAHMDLQRALAVARTTPY